MAEGPRYRVKFRRRREGKTDFRQRLRLLLSGQPRLVIRRSTKHIRAQLVLPGEKGDTTVASAVSIELSKYGYKGPTSNTPAAYLTGLLLGYKAKKAGFSSAVFDIGLQTASSGSKVFATVKGALDAGLEVPHDEEALPASERIRGEHIASYSKTKQLKGYEARGIRAEDLPREFEETKKKIAESFVKA